MELKFWNYSIAPHGGWNPKASVSVEKTPASKTYPNLKPQTLGLQETALHWQSPPATGPQVDVMTSSRLNRSPCPSHEASVEGLLQQMSELLGSRVSGIFRLCRAADFGRCCTKFKVRGVKGFQA